MNLTKADSLFSIHIKKRDKWQCQRCGKIYPKDTKRSLQCSHYWSRIHGNTRFETDNCIALCFGCHRLWGHGEERDEYKKFMKEKLGIDRFKTLDVQAHTYKKRDDKLVLLWLEGVNNSS